MTITKEFIECLPLTIQKLKLVSCSPNKENVQTLINYIHKSKSIKWFNISNDWHIKDNEIYANIFNTVKHNDTIEYLKMGHVLFHELHVSCFVDYIQITHNLQYLDLSNSELCTYSVDIFRVLSTNSTVQKLIVSNCKITDYSPIHDMLTINKTIRKLDLSYNLGGDNNIRLIADALNVNVALTSLCINSTKLTDDGIKSITDALYINNTLTRLDIITPLNTSNGTNYIVECLKINTSLRKLSVYNTPNVADLINTSNTLEKLYILNSPRNQISDWTNLVKCLETNYVLNSLDIIEYCIDKNITESIKKLIDRNISIRNNNRFIKTKSIMHKN